MSGRSNYQDGTRTEVTVGLKQNAQGQTDFKRTLSPWLRCQMLTSLERVWLASSGWPEFLRLPKPPLGASH